MSTLYEVSSLTSLVMNKPNIFSQVLGVLNKGDQIDVISISKSWAYFKYNNINAYVKKGNLKVLNTEPIESKGSVTLKYIDITTNNEIYPSETINNLQFGNYSYEAKIIYNYKLQNDSIQSVNLTEDDPDQMIIFYYNQIFGTITIEYIDINVNTDIYQPKTIENLSLGTYTYGAINISGYILSDNEIKTVTITEASPNATITFKYEEILGTVTIRYIDNSSSTELLPADTFTDLKLGNYSYNSKDISGYTITNDSTQTIELTDDNYNIEIEFKYNKLFGSVTIKYLDSSSLKEIDTPTIISNLPLGTYSYTAKSLEEYDVIGDSNQSVTLNDTNLNPIISFNYSRKSGNITIEYLDSSTLAVIHPSTKISNIALGSYTYDAIYIDNYEVDGDSSISTTLTTTEPNQTISFKYNEIEIPNDLNWNEVPYISNYYIKPIVKPGEEVFINYYITDYYYKEYMEKYNLKEDNWGDDNWTEEIWNNETFTVTVRVEGQDDKLYHYLKAGDHQVSLGSFNNEGEQKFSILCTDKYGRNSHELFNFFLVQDDIEINEYVMTEDDLINYKIFSSNSLENASETRLGLQALLDNKKSDGYNKIKLLEGYYVIDHTTPIYVPTSLTLDLNNSTIKLKGFTGAKCTMLTLNNTFNSHVINGIIEGDFYEHDYNNSPNSSEWVNGIAIEGEAKYSSFENITIKNITGYGSNNGLANSRDSSLAYFYIYPREIGNVFKLGDIDRNTGLDISSTTRTTSDFRDISGYENVGYLSVSRYLGYQGIPCNTWNIICHFYDKSKNFIKSTDAYQYRRIEVPSNANYMRITILEAAYPTSLSIQYFRVPTHCSFKDIKYENCRAVGMAQAAMKDMLVENCEFTNCGQNLAKCAYDAEDGWDMMQDVTLSKLNFHDNPNNELLTCAGHNFIVENQVQGKIFMYSRTRNSIIRYCKNTEISLEDGGIDSIVKHGIYRIYNNDFKKGSLLNNLAKNISSSGPLSGLVYNSTLGTLINNANYNNCTINIPSNFTTYITKITLNNCELIPTDTLSSYRLSFNGGHLDSCIFKDCKFKGKVTLDNHNYFYSAKFINCTFIDTTISPNVLANTDDIIYFENCNISYSSEELIYHSPFAYSVCKSTKVKFKNCTINAISSKSTRLIYGISIPTIGYCSFTDCIINIPDEIIIFDNKSGISSITNFTLKFINSPLPDKALNNLKEKIKNVSGITLIVE